MNDLLMLALLLDGPKHGYALKKRAGLIYGQEEMHNNIVYPLLRRFVAQGWVTRREAKGERGQTRTVYALTSAGRRALEERLSEFGEEEAKSAGEFRLRVGLFAILDGATRTKILETRKAYLEKEAQKFGAMEGQIEFEAFSGEVVRRMGEEIRSDLEWIERLRRMIRRGGKNGRERGKRRKGQ